MANDFFKSITGGVAGSPLSIQAASGQILELRDAGGTVRFALSAAGIITTATDLKPATDSARSLGSAALKWANVYGVNGIYSGDVTINGGDVTSSATTFNLLNGTVTTLNLGGAATAVNIGATTGVTTIANSCKAKDFRLSALNTAPATAAATGTLGEVRIDASFIYVAVATDTWKRVAIATW